MEQLGSSSRPFGKKRDRIRNLKLRFASKQAGADFYTLFGVFPLRAVAGFLVMNWSEEDLSPSIQGWHARPTQSRQTQLPRPKVMAKATALV